MLKKLRRRFVLLSMSMITVVLVLAFAVLLFFNHQQLFGNVDQALDREMNLSGDMDRDRDRDRFEIGTPGPRLPGFDIATFCVLLDENGEIREVINPSELSISGEYLDEIVEDALASGRERGTLMGAALRYAVRKDGQGLRIVFADIWSRQEDTYRLIGLSAAVGAGIWIALLFITIFLSRLIVRPVERAWTQQRRFIADASHELKTPLTVILANLDLLSAHQSEPLAGNLRWLESSREEAGRMRGLVEDMLFLARSDAGQDNIVPMEVQLSDTVMNCLLSFEPVAFEKGVELDSDVVPELKVQGDAAQLRRLTAILIDNAVKYAGDGGRVFVGLETREGHPVLRVENTGEKIPPEDAEHIFDRFYRTDPSRNSERGGYGLGLAIAREIAEHHGAKLELLPDEDGMTVFQVRFSA